ncbi:GNAT family N-acetyltransferase [Pseudoflavonifractor phocaeensis]|uniref:GNAT family N-acetyltransferase n=1 Tax=Pseudoflavonifractor phocaeensis TaxID=1870988 RepID=UPI00195683A6|nr:GNAT family N-acetyltransferase [Pseudoflavonifractor phocaeensis]MBM6869480.1 GNAT family N-acetyltransferase [Pseudoflavonifractor phocaeensis]
MTTLYIVRHAEAEGNIYRRIHGWYDSLITENGYRQIAALRERFLDIPVDAVYSSDLFRTMTTARAVYEPKGLELHTRRNLREISMGCWEDRTWGEVSRFDTESYQRYCACDPAWKNRGGESRDEARKRIYGAVLGLAHAHPGQTVAIFAHGDVIRCLQAEVLHIPAPEMKALPHCDNTGVTCLRVEGDRVEMVFRSDNSHLSPELSTLGRQQWWRKKGDGYDVSFWFRSMLGEEDRGLYESLYTGTWSELYGTTADCPAASLADRAFQTAKRYPETLICGMLNDQPGGLLQLDLEQGAERKAGHVTFLALRADLRKKGIAPQLLGQAISTFRKLGRDKVELLCAQANGPAQRFYRAHGFEKVAQIPGAHGPLDLLEKYIGYRPRPELS